MSKELVISASSHERRVAILEEGQLVEIYIEREKEFALVGSIYKGKVTRVLPGMQSAFVDIGLDGDAFLYVSDVFENLEDYDHGHGDAPVAATPMNRGGTPPIEVLPGETLAVAGGGHEEVLHLEPPTQEGHEGEPGVSELHGAASGHGVGEGDGSELEERQPESNASAPQNFSPSYNPTRNYPPRLSGDRGGDRGPGHDRGQGRDRGGDRGGDRGRGRRGRFGRRRGGGGSGDRRHSGGGRNLPPSKYASPQGDRDSRGYDNRRGPVDRGPGPSAPGESREDDIVLPGESLAKYRGRPQQAPVEQTREPEERQPDFEQPVSRPAFGVQPTTGGPRRFTGSLPHWVLADNETAGEPSGAESAAEERLADAAEAEAIAAEEHREQIPSEPLRSETAGLSDEELTALSARLVEAKHEEVQARADADTLAGGADFDEEEAQEEEALHEEHREEESEDLHEEHAEEIHAEESRLGLESEAAEEEHEETQAGLSEAERADLAHEEALEHVESEAAAAGGSSETVVEEDVVLLPGETRSPRSGGAPREEFVRRDSARIGNDPRSRFQRPHRGGRGRFDKRGGGDRDRGGRGRFDRRGGGGGHHHHRGHHGGHMPQRRPQLISEMLKAGQEVVVQIAKEPLGKKGARITSHVALPGRFLVYMPTIDHIGVSRKIASAENRSRLRRLVGEARGSYPGGFIVRTAAGGATDDEIRTDIEFLGKTWNEIKQKNDERKAPALLHRDLNLVERILRDYVSDDFTGIWIDSEEEFGKVVEFVSRFQPKLVSKVKLYTKEQPIFEEFGIQHELDKALRAKVWLKSGGYIVINHTEALVAIDVNTGKFVGKGSTRLEDTIVKTNLEAVKEIVRQIRLRDLGGIIVVDFIDMEERRNREKVLGALQMALEQDKAPSKALSFNEFGLVCITRKRTKQALERVLCQPCPYCTGSGMVKSIPTLCYEIQAEARKMATAEHEGPNLTLRVHPEIAKALKTRESILIDELEQNAHKHIIIQSDATLHWEQYDIY
ncbi:MAG: Rne/Rng family ribonuclease [Candidatus Acidiferrum sp.]|jgi:Rne/Rng family ribonuclease